MKRAWVLLGLLSLGAVAWADKAPPRELVEPPPLRPERVQEEAPVERHPWLGLGLAFLAGVGALFVWRRRSSAAQ